MATYSIRKRDEKTHEDYVQHLKKDFPHLTRSEHIMKLISAYMKRKK
jgi:hypothetical protein